MSFANCDVSPGDITEFGGGIAQEHGRVQVIASFGKGFLLGFDGTVAALAASPILANVKSLVIRRTKLRKDEAANLRAAFEQLSGARHLAID